MQKKTLMAGVIFALVVSTPTLARDSIDDYSVAEALSNEHVKTALGDSITFYFGNTTHPKIKKHFGEFKTNKKTNAFNKTNKSACQWVFASALKSLRNRAHKEGGNAVVNIRSNYRGNLSTSNTTFQCGAGEVIAGVALIGDIVLLEK